MNNSWALVNLGNINELVWGIGLWWWLESYATYMNHAIVACCKYRYLYMMTGGSCSKNWNALTRDTMHQDTTNIIKRSATVNNAVTEFSIWNGCSLEWTCMSEGLVLSMVGACAESLSTGLVLSMHGGACMGACVELLLYRIYQIVLPTALLGQY